METGNFYEKKRILTGVAGVLILFLLALTASSIVDVFNKIKENRYIGQDAEYKNTISVSGTGEVFASPDLAMVSLSVVNESKTVSEAMDQNTKKMNGVIQAMKDLGIKEEDLKTVYFNIYPRYEYERTELGYSTGKRYLAGYEVSQKLEVKIRDLEKIGEVIEKGTESGANEVSSLSFAVDKQEDFKKEAREQAVQKAKEKAEEMAGAVGVKIGKIVTFSENSYTPYYYERDLLMKEEVGMGGASAPNIEPGETKISVTVTITYEIY